MDNHTNRARELRSKQTKSEGILWSLLRGKQVCGLKFRRQHPIGPFYADFACVSQHLVVEVDGGYHDEVVESDLDRQSYLQQCGWTVLRFTDEEVEQDAEVVARAIAQSLGVEYEFRPRSGTGAGMESTRTTSRQKDK